MTRFIYADNWASVFNALMDRFHVLLGNRRSLFAFFFLQALTNSFWKGVEISQQQTCELLQLCCRFSCEFLLFVECVVAVKANPMCPRLQIFRNKAACFEFVDTLFQFPGINIGTEILQSNFKASPIHSCSGSEISPTKAASPLFVCLRGRWRHMFRSHGFDCLRPNATYANSLVFSFHQISGDSARGHSRTKKSRRGGVGDDQIAAGRAARNNRPQAPSNGVADHMGDVEGGAAGSAMRAINNEGGHEKRL